jgi:hypothetical protein
MTDFLREHVSGDAEGGWIVDLHDGFYHSVYSPVAETAEAALAMAHDEFKKAFYPEQDRPMPAVHADGEWHAGEHAGAVESDPMPNPRPESISGGEPANDHASGDPVA